MARQTGMKGLQLWCKNVTQGYEGVEITNMNKSFRDGLAFCAIIHHFRPDLIPYDTLKKGDVAHNNALAFKVAEEELDIAPLLDVEDMVELEVPDKLSIATYLISYYNYFKDATPPNSNQQATLSNRNLLQACNSTQQENERNSKSSPPSSNANKPKPPNIWTKDGNNPTSQLPKASSVVKPPVLKTLSVQLPTNSSSSSEVSRNNAASKLSEGLMKLQKKDVGGVTSPTRQPATATPSSPVKRPVVSVASVDSTSSATPPSANKPKERRQKFGAIEPETDKLKPTPPVTTPPLKPPSRRKSDKRKSQVNEMCEVCNTKVFLMQRLCAEGHIYHRHCFRCVRCEVALQSKSYEYDIQGDKFYCRLHFQEMNRSKSIKRNMIARGATGFDNTDLAVTDVTHDNDNEDWDIISTPPPTKKSAPPIESLKDQQDDQMKQDLPSLLSELAQKKRQNLHPAEPHPQAHPQTQKPDKTPMIPSSTVKVKNDGGNVPEKEKEQIKEPPLIDATAPPIKTHPIGTQALPAKSQPPPKTPPSPVSQPANKQPENRTSPKTPPARPPPPATSKNEKPRPPKPVRTGSTKANKTITATVLEHYEFSRQYYDENDEAQEVLKERYELPETTNKPLNSKTSDDAECSPYEIPTVTKGRSMTELEVQQPKKPQRLNRVGLVTIHKGDTWVKPYAISPLYEEFRDNNDKSVSRVKPKPIRPAPPLPDGVKRKNKDPPKVSPYAVSNVVQANSFATNELQRKRQRELNNCKKHLDNIDRERKQLEMKGVELEKAIRSEEAGEDDEDQLMEEWFSLVNDKDLLVRKESELVYMIRDIELINEKEALEMEIRRRLTKDDSTKSELEKAEEDAMMEELHELVMRRDKLMWQFDEDKIRDDETEQSITRARTMMTQC